MATALDIAWGYKAETTFGTPVVVDKFLPLVSESVTQEIERLESEGVMAGRRVIDTDQWKAGSKTIEGDIGFEIYEQSIGTLLKHALGTNNTTGVGPYAHAMSPGPLNGLGITHQFQKPDTGGTLRTFTYAGTKTASWELAIEAGQIATMGISLVGTVTESVVTAAASVSYAAQGTRPFTAIECTVHSIGGTATNMKAFKLSGDNGLDTDRRFIGTDLPAEPLEADRRTYEGEVNLEFSSLTDYARFTAGTEADIAATLSNGIEKLEIVAHARFDGATPSVGGRGLIMLDMPFKLVGDGSDADALLMTLTNDDATV